MVPCCDKPHIDERWGPSDEDIVRMRMSDILHRTANAVHGGPLENGWWSWHDLPELADGLYQAVKRVREKHADDGTGHCKTCGDNYGSQKYPCQTMRALLGVE